MNEKFYSMVGDNGRVNRHLFVEYLRQTTVATFLEEFRHPFLVGKELYEGAMGCGGTARTAVFEVTPPPARETNAVGKPDLEGGGISSAIYTMHKKPGSKTLANVLSVGRTNDNDLCIADYSISHGHAQIIIEYGHYSVIDLGSTNGTHLNDRRLEPKQKTPVMPDDMLAFGRIVFVFLTGRALYDALLQMPSH